MKKYLSITGYVILYLILIFAYSLLVQRIWFGGLIAKKFAESNYDYINLISFSFTLLTFALIYKLRKKSLIKTMKIYRLSSKNLGIMLLIGALMGVFTCSICNTSYVINNFKTFEQLLNAQINGISNFFVFLIVIAVMFSFEEMIFRGTIFNEIRSGVPLGIAIILGTAVYGLLNTYIMGVAIGIYASIAALFYTLAYVFTRSLLASMILQVVSQYVISISIKTGLWQSFRDLGDGILTAIIAVVVLAILTIYYLMFGTYKRAEVSKSSVAVV